MEGNRPPRWGLRWRNDFHTQEQPWGSAGGVGVGSGERATHRDTFIPGPFWAWNSHRGPGDREKAENKARGNSEDDHILIMTQSCSDVVLIFLRSIRPAEKMRD